MIVEYLTDIASLAAWIETALALLVSPEWYRQNFVALFNVIVIDLVLAGDNAIVIGLAASRVAKDIRAKVIFWGIAAAVILRILFASITVQLLAIVGLTFAGGLLLLWVCWKMYRQITEAEHDTEPSAKSAGAGAAAANGANVSFWTAVWQITLADIAMSLDNVLAVAGAARDEPLVLVIGLTISIVLMAVAAHMVANLLSRYPWITWIGLAIIVWVALDMIYEGSHEISCEAWSFGCSESLFHAILDRIGLVGG